MKRALPPFAAVKAFEAAARHLSFAQAAGELCVSPSAISHQIRNLELYLATELFRRVGNRIELTITGQSYHNRLHALLDGLDEATRAVREQSENQIRVLTTPGLAARWLVPRLDGFEHAGKVRLRISGGPPDTDFSRNEADLVVMWGADPLPRAVIYPLLRTFRYPVISSQLARDKDVRKPKDLLHLNLMRDEVDDHWEEWFAAAGVGKVEMPSGPVYPHCELASTAAEHGKGVALAYDAIIRPTLAAGGLIRIFDTVTTPKTIYSVAIARGRENEPLLAGFRDWLLSCAAEDGDLPRDISEEVVQRFGTTS